MAWVKLNKFHATWLFTSFTTWHEAQLGCVPLPDLEFGLLAAANPAWGEALV